VKRIDQVWDAIVESRREPEPEPVPDLSLRAALNRNPYYRAIRRPFRPVKRIARRVLGKGGVGEVSET
jgi:hypothetical protein